MQGKLVIMRDARWAGVKILPGIKTAVAVGLSISVLVLPLRMLQQRPPVRFACF
jgi:hypothetical protein